MQIFRMSYASEPLNILLSEILSCTFQPSAYRGNGTEERLGVVFKTSDILYQAFATIEARCRGLLCLDNIEKLDELWCPIARSNEFGQTLRAKINVKGDNACLFWNTDDEHTGSPDDFRAVNLQAVCSVRGVYVTKASIGLIVDVTSLKYKERAAAEIESPFLNGTNAS